MKPFDGFSDGKARLVPIPSSFFTELLPGIQDLAELKLILYFMWRLDHLEGTFRSLSRSDLAEDELFMQGLADPDADPQLALDGALERLVQRKALLKAEMTAGDAPQAYYFLNSPKGRAALEAIRQGKWRPSREARQVVSISQERPKSSACMKKTSAP